MSYTVEEIYYDRFFAEHGEPLPIVKPLQLDELEQHTGDFNSVGLPLNDSVDFDSHGPY